MQCRTALLSLEAAVLMFASPCSLACEESHLAHDLRRRAHLGLLLTARDVMQNFLLDAGWLTPYCLLGSFRGSTTESGRCCVAAVKIVFPFIVQFGGFLIRHARCCCCQQTVAVAVNRLSLFLGRVMWLTAPLNLHPRRSQC